MHENGQIPLLLVDPKDNKPLSDLWFKLNGFVSIEAAEAITTLDKTTQYRERLRGRFPKLISLTSQGRRKAYRIQDLKAWLDNPQNYSQKKAGRY